MQFTTRPGASQSVCNPSKWIPPSKPFGIPHQQRSDAFLDETNVYEVVLARSMQKRMQDIREILRLPATLLHFLLEFKLHDICT